MDYHHVIEAAGVVSLGLVAYSYLVRWSESAPPGWRRARPIAIGLVFGVVAVVLMVSRIHVGGDRFVDARAVPIALVMLVEGGPAGVVAASLAAAYRIWLGGSGAVAGVLAIAVIAGAAFGVRTWARSDGGIGLRHSFALSLAVWAITGAAFLMLGARGRAMFAPVWLALLILYVVGIGLVARLFAEVVASQDAERSRREAAQLRAVATLANAAAHEINNPLTAVIGGLSLAARGVPADTEQARWIASAKEGAERIRDIVRRMNHITTLEEVPRQGALPPMLDIRKSSAPS
ncbi:MAG TPA: histidine kinase dimerization/phospho-acceptor domain-containing protein [Methylomirabilota bacterium]|nr:histidine kinase dimerization/phospho-acceptor domain-containing protein [Methylomirabilota bacterium]